VPADSVVEHFDVFEEALPGLNTNLMKSGLIPQIAPTLARHSTIELTMKVYTSLTVTNQAAALQKLPGVSAIFE
jgi:hypothetical protein